MATSLSVLPQRAFVVFDSGCLDHAQFSTKTLAFAGASQSPRVSRTRDSRINRQCQLRQMHKLVDDPPVRWPVVALVGRDEPDEEEDDDDGDSSEDANSAADESSGSDNSSNDVNSERFREQMERMLDNDDAAFAGKDLAILIRKKYGRSYDVQLIKKDFMGRQLLAMNVMWKYREQRSFPLTEEEYLLHLDSIASTLKGWGAVSYVRSTLAKTKERPRIGKAVSISIDLDEAGGRANEWIGT